MGNHSDEIAHGERFRFGSNWQSFLSVVDDSRLQRAVKSLKVGLGRESLDGVRVLDIGCGSGMFSLAARHLGANVFSFDFDPQSVACTQELKNQFFPDDGEWQIEEGSVLDETYLNGLGKFDIVYSWGVLHHTGAMYRAFDNALNCLSANGQFYISIYNDQGGASKRWRSIKKFYCGLPQALQIPFAVAVMAPREAVAFVGSLITLRPHRYWRRWNSYGQSRGMSRWHDHVDWLGGFPFEFASPEDVIHYFRDHGLIIEHLKTVGGGNGCNEFVFRRLPSSAQLTRTSIERAAA